MDVQRGICSAVSREKFNILRRNGRCPLLFSAAFRVSFSGKGLRVLLLGKGRYFKEGKGESERASGIGRAFRKNASGEYFIFSQ